MRIGITYDLKTGSSPPLPRRREGEESPAADLIVPDDWQEEFDSPVTIEAIAQVLRGLGHEVIQLGDGREMLERLLADPPDFVFNIAEGQGVGRSREARVPAVLEMLGIPYSGSDPLTLAVTLDKDCAKRLVQSVGVAVPRGLVLNPSDDPKELRMNTLADFKAEMRFPLIAKPAWEGSSKGIRSQCVLNGPEDWYETAFALLRDYRQPVLIEEFIQGDELTVGVLGGDWRSARLLGMMRVLPQQPTDYFVYSVQVKRDYERQVRYECPPRLPQQVVAAVEEAALKAYQVLGCRDFARVDFRLRNGVPYFLEINPLPGLNPKSSDLVIMARLCGWSYEQLVGSILEAALNRIEDGRWKMEDGGSSIDEGSYRSRSMLHPLFAILDPLSSLHSGGGPKPA